MFEAQIMKKLSNTEAELKKSVVYKKSLYQFTNITTKKFEKEHFHTGRRVYH